MKKKLNAFIPRNAATPLLTGSARRPTASGECWKWGEDNLFPIALGRMYRRSVAHRRIINDKADYIAGRGFSFDPDNTPLAEIVQTANGHGQTLREVLHQLSRDKALFGNAFLEVVTDPSGSFLSLFHQDATRCRLSRNSDEVILHHDWSCPDRKSFARLPLHPRFESRPDGTLRSMIHFKDYEPGYRHYGTPSYIAGMNVTAIAYKTDLWNIARLDNSFQLSGVMMIDASVDNQAEADELVSLAERRFAGRPGQVMFMVKEGEEQDHSRFIPIDSSNEGDWKDLHQQAMTDIIVAHSWFRTLSGLDYSAGFSSERILHEYQIALNTLIIGQQNRLLEPLRALLEQVLRIDASSLQIINLPPSQGKPAYMKVWEARKADGLDYDPEDPAQQLYLAQIAKTA